MKTSEQALTEWVNDDIMLNYVDGRGPQHHNRDQFVKVCNVLRAGNESAAPEDVTQQTQAPLASGMPWTVPGIVSGQINHMPGFGAPLAISGVIHSGPAGSWEAKRADISNVINWGAVGRVHAASATFRALLEKRIGISEPWLDSQIRGFFDPRKIARFENVREIIDCLIRLGQRTQIKGS